MELFSGVIGREYFSSCNDSLYMELDDGAIVKDDFRHEQNLLIREAGKTVLIAGCAHNGIVNIMKHVYDRHGRDRKISEKHRIKILYGPLYGIRSLSSIKRGFGRPDPVFSYRHCS